MLEKIIDKIALPTESLYKLLSFTGILIVLLAFAPFYFDNYTTDSLIELDTKGQLMVLEAKTLAEKMQRVAEEGDSVMFQLSLLLDDVVNKKSGSFEKLNNFMSKEPEAFHKFPELEQSGIEIKRNLIKYTNEIASTFNRIGTIEYYKQKSWYAFVVGGLFIAIGFLLWYFKEQKHTDIILKAEATKARMSIPKKKIQTQK